MIFCHVLELSRFKEKIEFTKLILSLPNINYLEKMVDATVPHIINSKAYMRVQKESGSKWENEDLGSNSPNVLQNPFKIYRKNK